MELDEEALIAWQDVLDEIAAGRPGNCSCPNCGHQPLDVVDNQGRTRISCKGCGKFLEGQFGSF